MWKDRQFQVKKEGERQDRELKEESVSDDIRHKSSVPNNNGIHQGRSG